MRFSRIGIRAGHNCSPDIGASGNGLQEDNVVLAVATRLIKLLSDDGLVVTNCNPAKATTVGSSLRQGVERANAATVGLFVSIHANAAESAQAKGVEVYHFAGNSDMEELSRIVAKDIAVQLSMTNRGAKTANFYELRSTNADAILIELGFLTNKGDAEILRESVDKFATTIFKAIKKWNNGSADCSILPDNTKLSYACQNHVAPEHEELLQTITY
jgi:N-acetylmuramoyl-L-alanine amidase